MDYSKLSRQIIISAIAIFVFASILVASPVTLKLDNNSTNMESLSNDSVLLLSLHEVMLYYKVDFQWDATREQMALSKEGMNARLILGNQRALINGNRIRLLSKPPIILQGAIMLPPQDIALILSDLLPSMYVSYDAATAIISVSTSGNPFAIKPGTEFGSFGFEEGALAGSFELRTVVIDAGHGGHDPGATRRGVREKDIVLDIALRLSRLLKSQSELQVVLTRDSDEFITLGRRTRIANNYPANSTLFISIHCNASRSRVGGYGTETYMFDLEATDAEARALAARENAGEEMDLTRILSHCYHVGTEPYTLEIARRVQVSVTGELGLSNRGIRRAPFYVLAGTKMPAILLELAYISNNSEREKLQSEFFRQRAAEALFDAIVGFSKPLAKDRTR